MADQEIEAEKQRPITKIVKLNLLGSSRYSVLPVIATIFVQLATSDSPLGTSQLRSLLHRVVLLANAAPVEGGNMLRDMSYDLRSLELGILFLPVCYRAIL
ncbi:MAG: hypothetical protein NWF14_00500, partial [Candidatus Bathyarchaeota archaeon]|nr:hypothetical protein [Candidatus Bathyarchaeota archaeon]